NCIIDSLSQSFLVELLPYLMQLLFDSLKFLAINFSVACICSLCQLIDVITNRSQLLCYLNRPRLDRKSTRLNSSHVSISYAVFCLQKKIKIKEFSRTRYMKLSLAVPLSQNAKLLILDEATAG